VSAQRDWLALPMTFIAITTLLMEISEMRKVGERTVVNFHWSDRATGTTRTRMLILRSLHCRSTEGSRRIECRRKLVRMLSLYLNPPTCGIAMREVCGTQGRLVKLKR
jgi:hypothetical protein